MNNIQYLLKKHSTLIMTVVASGGVIVTTVLAVKATPKAQKLLKQATLSKGEPLTTIEKIKYGWKPYIGCGISCLATLGCIASIEYLNHQKQISLVSAYTILQNSFEQYRGNIKQICGDDVDLLARQEIVRARYEGMDDPHMPEDEEILFFDYQGMRFFWSSFHNVMAAEHKLLESLHARGYACLNEYYDYLGIPRLDYGYQLGWADYESCDPYNVHELEFNYEQTFMGKDKDVQCFIISASLPATFDYIL